MQSVKPPLFLRSIAIIFKIYYTQYKFGVDITLN